MTCEMLHAWDAHAAECGGRSGYASTLVQKEEGVHQGAGRAGIHGAILLQNNAVSCAEFFGRPLADACRRQCRIALIDAARILPWLYTFCNELVRDSRAARLPLAVPLCHLTSLHPLGIARVYL